MTDFEGPTADVVARHRAELDGALRRRRLLPAAGLLAAAAIVAVVVAVAGRTDRGDAIDVATAPTTGATAAPVDSTAPASTFPCGAALPFDVPLPDSMTGPHEGPASLPDRHAGAGVRTVSWGNHRQWVEARYPSAEPKGAPTKEGGAYSTSVQIGLLDDGHFATEVELASPAIGEAGCDSLLLTAIGETQASADDLANRLLEQITARGGPLGPPVQPLLVGDPVPAAELPDVVPCSGGPVPNRHGEGDGTIFADVAAALQWVLDDAGTFPPDGYQQLLLPDGRIAATQSSDLGTLIVAVFAPVADGTWQVESWEATGC